MADDKKILHINDLISALSNGQIAVEIVADSDLGFRMWGGKDYSGDAVKFLAKDKAAQILSLIVTGLAGANAGLVRHDTSGDISGGLIAVADLNALISDATLDSTSDPRNLTVYDQAAEPTLTNGDTAIWVDTDDSNRTWLIMRYSGVQRKVEMT